MITRSRTTILLKGTAIPNARALIAFSLVLITSILAYLAFKDAPHKPHPYHSGEK